MQTDEASSNDDGGSRKIRVIGASTTTALCISVLKTLALFLSWVCLGLYAEVLGPSLQTYSAVTFSDTEQIGFAFSMREVGMFFGSLFGALLADLFVGWRHITMACTLIMGAASILSVPWCETVAALSATFFFSGVAHGAMTSNGNPLLNSIWLDKSGGPFNFMHSGYGVGAALAPAVLAPFSYYTTGRLDASGNDTSTPTAIIKIIDLRPPYGIIAGLCFFSACCFFCFNLCSTIVPTSEKEGDEEDKTADVDLQNSDEFNAKEEERRPSSSSSISRGRRQRLFAFLIRQRYVLLYLAPPAFLLYAALVGNERVFSKYLYVSANEGPAGLSKEDCFLLTGVYWIVFALARIISVPASYLIPLTWLFGIQLVGAWAMAFGLYLAPQTRLVYFAFTVCFGLFKSPLFPTGLAVISSATPVTGMVTFVVNLGSSVGASVLQYVAGLVLHRQGRQKFPLLVMVTGLVLVFIGTGLLLVTHLYRRRFGKTALRKYQTEPFDE